MPQPAEPSRSVPDWVPEGSQNDPHFAVRVVSGDIRPASRGSTKRPRAGLSLENYAAGVLAGDIGVLSRAITLVESNRPEHQALAQELVQRILPNASQSVRVGITGVPGAGKSTMIEALGTQLCEAGHKVAVLAVDPSSSVSGGSILGDKTRMAGLVRRRDAFIRPSPSGGSLGGVTRKSRETILLCEAAGFDVILVETVGVGQNEITVRSMVDFFLLIMLAGAGDELQGMKKGVIEIADLLAVNKADGENRKRAELACAESNRVLHILQPATPGWQTRCVTCSAREPQSLAGLWAIIEDFVRTTKESGEFPRRRERQAVEWMHAMIEEELRRRFYQSDRIKRLMPGLERQVREGGIPVATAVSRIMAG
jgi:LAO/AO transport system kinase